MMKAVVCRVF